MLNTDKIRQDFPLLASTKTIYFDSACMSLRPRQVINKILEYYEQYPACAGRSTHHLASRVNREVELARQEVAKFIGAKKEEIVFTKNTTEGLNLVINSLGLKQGDVVLIAEKVHNSNLVPLLVSKNKGVVIKVIKSKEDGSIDLNHYAELVKGAKLVSMVYTSNLDGYTIPAQEIIKLAHKAGALVLLDAAQAAPHKEIDVRKLDADFLAFSGHKMCGPSGIGVLYGKKKLLEQLNPFLLGGDTVESTTYESFKLLPVPEKFEAGLQHYSGIIGLGEACRYLNKIGLKNIEKHEVELANYLKKQLAEIKGIKVIHKDVEGGLVSFYHEKIGYHDIALMLDEIAKICVRSGQFCVHSWFNANKVKGAVRVSFYLYNTKDEVDVFVKTLKEIVATLG